MPTWRAKAAKVAQRLTELHAAAARESCLPWLDDPFVMHLARLALMLADHHHSSLPRCAPDQPHVDEVRGDGQGSLYANTGAGGRLRQRLDAHLLGVQRDAARVVHGLTRGLARLPALQHAGLRKRSGQGRFHWQDQAADLAAQWRGHAAAHGGFIVNMASTGCGKTLANARLMNALADPARGLRCSFALGLRSLTLQTGRAYRQALNLKSEQLALRVGGSANRALFEHHQRLAEAEGSASAQALIEEDGEVIWEGEGGEAGAQPLLGLTLHDARIRRLVAAPLLVCTIDHLTPATEAQRGGRQIAPMLRLLSSDLVLDELDDFDLADLPAVTRLVHWAGLLGARVLVSSATLPPSLLQGCFEAYRAGRLHWHRHRGEASIAMPEIACLWADEHGAQAQACADALAFEAAHSGFVGRRCAALRQAPCARRGALLPLPPQPGRSEDELHRDFAQRLLAAIGQAHADHAQRDPRTGQRVSFGLVRMANIEPLIEVAKALFALDAPSGLRLHVCVYHARHPLLVRSAIEAMLDAVFDRRQPERCFHQPVVRERLDAAPGRDHVFAVLASPVIEVGRDFDADWAIAEPSSMRALIQLAGRVQRHRNLPGEAPNVWVFERNLRALKRPDDPAFVRPGFEPLGGGADHIHRLRHHDLGALLDPQDLACLRALPRITEAAPLRPRERLVDLEHARLRELMLPAAPPAGALTRRGKPPEAPLNAASFWQHPRATLTGVLPQQQPFRQRSQRETTLLFLPDEADEGELRIHRIHEEGRAGQQPVYVAADASVRRVLLPLGQGIQPWGRFDVAELLPPLAEAQGLSLRQAAERFTVVTVPENEQGWRWHPVLGFATNR